MANSKTRQSNPTEDLRKDFEALRDDVGALAEMLKDQALESRSRAADAAADRVVALKAASQERLDEIRARATDAAKSAEDVVRRNPAYSVAGAAAAGFLLGALTARRR